MNKKLNTFFNYLDRKDLRAIIKSDLSVTYKELFEKAAQLTSDLINNGIKKRDYVPLLIDDNLKFIETTIALWNLGTVPVPLNIKLLDEEIFSIIDDYDFKFLITDRLFPFNKRNENLKIIFFDNIKSSSIQKNFALPNFKDEAVVIFTSGSTGRPKGVVHTFLTLTNSIETGNEILNHHENDRWLASLPLYHIGGFQIICRSLYYGCSIIIPDSLKSIHLAEAIINYKPTHVSLVSTQLERLINLKVKPKESLRVSLIGGGFINDDLMFESEKLGWNPFRVYGSSETASFITAIASNEIFNCPQSAGKALGNTEIKTSDESEILIKSNCLFQKYLDDEKETHSKLADGFYHTGDLGFVDKDGYLFIEARRNDLIVSGGENVNPIEVEKVLLEFPFIIEACVFPKPNKIWGQIVAAVIVCRDKSISEKTLKEKLKQKLSGFKIPKQFTFVDKLPRTSLGKLERGKIRKMF